jgi:hypothetical protein
MAIGATSLRIAASVGAGGKPLSAVANQFWVEPLSIGSGTYDPKDLSALLFISP